MDLLSLIVGQLLASDADDADGLGKFEKSLARIEETFQRWRRLPGERGAGGALLHRFPDLREVFDKALQCANGDRRKVWCMPALGFESQIETRCAILTGGAYAPVFLQREPESLGWPHLPGAHLCHARLLLAHSLDHSPSDWVEFLEGVKESGEPLVLLASSVRPELLAMLAMNAAHKTIRTSVLHPGDWKSSLDDLARALAAHEKQTPMLAAGQTPEKSLRKRLPRVTVTVRRDAAVMEPVQCGDAPPSPDLPLTETVWISVGGDDFYDQQNRLLALYDALSDDRHTTKLGF